MDLSALIRFDGPWSDGEREIVEEAAKDVETTRPSRPVGQGTPWIMVRSGTEAQRTYLASHIQTETIFRGRSAEALADRIRGLA